MYSTTTIVKNSRLDGRIIGTHQQLDLIARKVLSKYLPRGRYFPSGREIIHFEGMRGPDGLKRKSPGVDEPSHMLDEVLTLIPDYYWNLVHALKAKNHVRAAFEAAWLAHMITDGLTPAHHFPLSSVKEGLMTDKEMLKVFGQPIKGVMHGRNMLETMRNNWLYWGARGDMTQHIAYEYGVLMIAASLPRRAITPKLSRVDLEKLSSVEEIFNTALKNVQSRRIYDHFRDDGWTTDLALETKNFLLPEIAKTIMLIWYLAAVEAYNLSKKPPKTLQDSDCGQTAFKAKKPISGPGKAQNG